MQSQNLEAQLEAFYLSQERGYQELLELAKALPAVDPMTPEYDSSLEKMQTLMADVERQDKQHAAARTAWDASGQVAGTTLKEAVARVRVLMLEVLSLVGVAETNAKKAKTLLEPKMAASWKRKKVQMAYTAHSDSK